MKRIINTNGTSDETLFIPSLHPYTIQQSMLLSRSFYTRSDVTLIARELLGKYLCTSIDGLVTCGMICETEAYAGVTDRASHAFGGRRTPRTETMFREGGTAYIYLCYGIHSLFNVVTNRAEIPHAVLIRGIVPAEGTKIMLRRIGSKTLSENSGTGPGRVARLLGIHYSFSGLDLIESFGDPRHAVWIEDRGILVDPGQIQTGLRIGVDYAGEDALLPYRFVFHGKGL
ncbi:MAG TPA: DNA-3-methyladenine glycosylase [Bacteroidales bacterium]|nr:DNA-3-methyladenine glycosylase [Bacteroidales bacterium]